jgi:hypothetical protein
MKGEPLPKKLTHAEKVVRAVGKRPQTATQIAEKLGHKSHQSVSRALGEAVSRGEVVKTDKGFQKAI